MGASCLVVLAGVVSFRPAVVAQQPAPTPPVGDLVLATGFSPDPMERRGQTRPQTSLASLGAGCNGFGSDLPDHKLILRNDFPWLRIFAESSSDTTLAIRTPSGQVICADDTFNRDPGISQAMPAGIYQVYVGSYSQGEVASYRLAITTQEALVPGMSTEELAPSSRACGLTKAGRSACIDATSRRTNRGCRGGRAPCTLRTGFSPDPWTFPLSAGGGRDPIDVASLNLRDAANAQACTRAYITPRPDFRFVFTAGTNFPLLRFYVVTENGADATLLVNTPEGRWRCNDDSFQGRMPTIDFRNPPPGQYDVWVGTYDASSRNPATFFVTEVDSNHP